MRKERTKSEEAMRYDFRNRRVNWTGMRLSESDSALMAEGGISVLVDPFRCSDHQRIVRIGQK